MAYQISPDTPRYIPSVGRDGAGTGSFGMSLLTSRSSTKSLTLQDDLRQRPHSDRNHSTSYDRNDIHLPTSRREATMSTDRAPVTSAIPIPASRPRVPQRYDSMNESIPEAGFGGTSYHDGHSYSRSHTSRRPSDATEARTPGFRSRTDSVSSTGTEYGIPGYLGWPEAQSPPPNTAGSLFDRQGQSSSHYVTSRRPPAS